MRSIIAAIVIASFVGCTDASDVNGPDKNNLSLRVEVTGDTSLAPASFRLSLNGIPWTTVAGGQDQSLFVPYGSHTIGLTPFDNIVDEGWCLQLEPSSLGARFTRNNVIHARFHVYCPSATGTGTLIIVGKTSLSFTVVLTRIVGIPGSQTLKVPGGSSLVSTLTAGLYRIEILVPCKGSSLNSNALPAIAVRNGETATLTVNVNCFVFKLPPGFP